MATRCPARSTLVRAGWSSLAALVLATATACTTSGQADPGNSAGKAEAADVGATETPRSQEPVVKTEAIQVLGREGMLVAGRLQSSQRPQLWRCASLTEISECDNVSPPGMSRSEYVDDIASSGRASYWVLTIDVDRQRSRLRTTTNGGESWVQHAAPAHGLSAGSRGTIQAFGDRQALLTLFWANGPVVRQYRTNDAGASWQRVGEIDLGS